MSVQEFYYYYMWTLRGVVRNNPDRFRMIGYLPFDWLKSGPGPEAFRDDVGFSMPGTRLVLVISPAIDQFSIDVLAAGTLVGAFIPGRCRPAVDIGVGRHHVARGSTFRDADRGRRRAQSDELHGRGAQAASFYWTRGDDWSTLLAKWGLPAVAASVLKPARRPPPEVVQVSGAVTAAGAGRLEAAYRMPAGVTDTPTAGPYTIALVDGGGHDLATFSFPASFTPDSAQGANLESVPLASCCRGRLKRPASSWPRRGRAGHTCSDR